MNLVILGPQGSGKGTQAELLAKKYDFNYIEMGNILRSISDSKNQWADKIRVYLEKGEKVPDEMVRLIAWDHVSKMDGVKGFLFDGYPRGLPQYEHLKDMLMKFGKKIDRVIYINISEREIIRRLSARRVCQKCGRIYNLITNPSPAGEECICGGELQQRDDDKPKAIKRRLAWGWTRDVKEKARKEGVLLEIDGERPIGEIQDDIVKKLGLK